MTIRQLDGLQLIVAGSSLVTNDDHGTAERAGFVDDALSASIKQDQAVDE